MTFFWFFFSLIVLQRASELFIARRNEVWMKERGAYEVGMEHYKYIVAVHLLFLCSLVVEYHIFDRQLSQLYLLLIVLFFITQAIRIWAIQSLGKYWNTKIIILPDANIIKKGPYKYLKHPNYVVVALELILFPLLFNAYFTAVIFTLLNMLVLSIRIPVEERALEKFTNYESMFENQTRFIPIKNVKKLRKY